MDQELRDTFVSAVKTLRDQPATKRGRVGEILNAPFTVTILGGALLAAVSGLVTSWNAHNEKDRQFALERLRQKQAFVETFNTKIERYFEFTFGLRKREIFLHDFQSSPDRERIRYPDGRSFAETREQWEKDKQYWLDHSVDSASGVIYTGKILFTTPDVRAKLDNLNYWTDQYGRAKTYKDLQQAYDNSLKTLDETAIAMAAKVYEK
jgi:hypothetical protein